MARLLRIPCHDDDNNTSFVLVHVNGLPGGSSRPLDLILVGTEGTAPYILTLKQSKVSSLKSKNGPCTQDEWTIILKSILLGAQAIGDQAELLRGVETVALIQENKSIDVTVRKRTEGITQRLGAFSLSYDENQEIELFEWCGIAVQSNLESTSEIASYKSKFQEQQETIAKLNSQLEELITAKATHEAELLEKFRDLLNEKKLKIRDQQRLLATAKVDPKKLAAVQAARHKEEPPAGPSRGRKRKADKAPQEDEDEDEDEGFEKMDVDVDQLPNDSDQQDVETPDEDETQSEDDSEEETDPQTQPPAADTRQAKKGDVADETSSNLNPIGKLDGYDQDLYNNRPKTPPRRELPFAKKKQAQMKPPVQDDEETASEDDKL